MINFRAAGRNAKGFPDPKTVNPTRYISLHQSLQGNTVFNLLGQDFVNGAAADVLRAACRVQPARRQASYGVAGTLCR